MESRSFLLILRFSIAACADQTSVKKRPTLGEKRPTICGLLRACIVAHCRPNQCQKRPTIGAKEIYYLRTFESLPARSLLLSCLHWCTWPPTPPCSPTLSGSCPCACVCVCVCERERERERERECKCFCVIYIYIYIYICSRLRRLRRLIA